LFSGRDGAKGGEAMSRACNLKMSEASIIIIMRWRAFLRGQVLYGPGGWPERVLL